MPHTLENNILKVEIDLPHEGYSFSRFDWTGKISEVRFNGKLFSGRERFEKKAEDLFGKGFYNEFGIETALGFEDAPMNGWFHKIGIGLLKKVRRQYLFHEEYPIRPARFDWTGNRSTFQIKCTSENNLGYAYTLAKLITLKQSGFEIHYRLENLGEKEIQTQEYGHNFLAIDGQLVGKPYVLKFHSASTR